MIEVKGCRDEGGVPFPDRKWSRNQSNVITVHYHDSPPQESHSSGSAYSLGITSGEYSFGGTSPSITLDPAWSKWRITLTQTLKFNNATYSPSVTVTTKLRRTNNTATDVTNSTRTLDTGVRSSVTETWLTLTTVVDYTVTATGGDIIKPYGHLGGSTPNGVQVTECSLVAVPVCDD